MRIALLSDTHDDLHNLSKALARIRQDNIRVILHAGDVTHTHTLEAMCGFDVWIAKGNSDRAVNLTSRANTLFGFGRLHSVHDIELDGKRIALVHGDQSREWSRLVKSHEYDYVVSGHTHKVSDERFGSTRTINPGALGSNRWEQPSFAILDVVTDNLEIIRIA